jgi:hypothetical protein
MSDLHAQGSSCRRVHHRSGVAVSELEVEGAGSSVQQWFACNFFFGIETCFIHMYFLRSLWFQFEL